MEIRKIGTPVVTHRNTSQMLGKLKRVGKQFFKAVEQRASKAGLDEEFDWDNPEDDNLLDLRRALVATIKEGMYERKDMEIEIAMLAMFVWFNRLAYEEQQRILMSG